MKNSLLFLLFLFLGQMALAQSDANLARVEGTIADYQSNLKTGEVILFQDKSSKKNYEAVSNAQGQFETELPCGATYLIKIQGFKEEKDYSEFEIPNPEADHTSMVIEIDIKYEPSKRFTLRNVYFESGKYAITKNSHAELDELVAYLKLKQLDTIEIGGHTDNIGGKEANQVLSQKRAEEIVKYLIKMGIEPKRLTAVGYGEQTPIANNDSVEGRKLNRRTEVKITSSNAK